MLLQTIVDFLDRFAPRQLAEDWDNVGLLVGDPSANTGRVMTCLTITEASAQEAVEKRVDLIVTHHPLPFRPLKRITTETSDGKLLWKLIRAGVAVYSPHTGFDSAHEGINQRLAVGLGLESIEPLKSAPQSDGPLGAGRSGRLPCPISVRELADRLKVFLSLQQIQVVGSLDGSVTRIGVACGSAGEFLAMAQERGCNGFVTGETRFHTCLEAEAAGIAMLVVGHYASERFAVEALAKVLEREFQALEVWASGRESDPLKWV